MARKRVITEIRIDHDIPFSEYDTSHLYRWVKRVPYKVKDMSIRRSCGGNTHVLMNVYGDLSPIDQLLIRAIMHDDSRRIRGDLERYAIDAKVFGLLFDEKMNLDTGIHAKAGEWIKI